MSTRKQKQQRPKPPPIRALLAAIDREEDAQSLRQAKLLREKIKVRTSLARAGRKTNKAIAGAILKLAGLTLKDLERARADHIREVKKAAETFEKSSLRKRPTGSKRRAEIAEAVRRIKAGQAEEEA